MSGDAKTSRLGNIRKNSVRFFKDIRGELKRVIWPTRKQVTNNTAAVLAGCLIVGAIIWVADAGLAKLAGVVFIR